MTVLEPWSLSGPVTVDYLRGVDSLLEIRKLDSFVLNSEVVLALVKNQTYTIETKRQVK